MPEPKLRVVGSVIENFQRRIPPVTTFIVIDENGHFLVDIVNGTREEVNEADITYDVEYS